jgi:hypothetical protein
MIRKWVVLMVLSLMFVRCERLHELFPTGPSPIRTQTALVIVSENAGKMSTVFDYGYNFSQPRLPEVFREILKINPDVLDTLLLGEILDYYWEDWVITRLREIACEKYDSIFCFTDETATAGILLDNLSNLRTHNFTIDCIFCLGGTKELIYFSDKEMLTDLFVDKLKERKIEIRSLYQTGSYGSRSIAKWQRIGIAAINGSSGINHLSLFSPVYFLQEWLDGFSFSEAVQRAREKEKIIVLDYLEQYPELNYFVNVNWVIDESRHEFGGQTPDLLWHNKSEWQY